MGKGSKYPSSINEKLQTIETVLDGFVQSLQKTPHVMEWAEKKGWESKLRKILGHVRSLQAEFPQPSYSLLRFRNIDELPQEKDRWRALTGRARSLARSDWHKFKRLKMLKEKQSTISEHL